MNQKVKSIGGNYIPPSIKGSPKMQAGVATITLVETLSQNARQSFQTAFHNYCEQKQLKLQMVIRGIVVTIKRATHKILYEVLKWLEIERPQPKAPTAKYTTGQDPRKKAQKAARINQAIRPPIGLRLAISR